MKTKTNTHLLLVDSELNVPRMRISLYNGQKIIIVQTKVTFNCAGDAIFFDYNTNEKVCVSTGNIDSIVVTTTY